MFRVFVLVALLGLAGCGGGEKTMSGEELKAAQEASQQKADTEEREYQKSQMKK